MKKVLPGIIFFVLCVVGGLYCAFHGELVTVVVLTISSLCALYCIFNEYQANKTMEKMEGMKNKVAKKRDEEEKRLQETQKEEESR